jgi:hypothetical protein
MRDAGARDCQPSLFLRERKSRQNQGETARCECVVTRYPHNKSEYGTPVYFERADHVISREETVNYGRPQTDEALRIFVTRDKWAHFLGRVLYGNAMSETGRNEIQELHAKEVGVGNPSEERASS